MSVALAIAEHGRPSGGQSPGRAGRDAEPVDHQSTAGPESPVPGRRRVLVYHQDEVRRQVGSKVFRMLHKPVHPSELLLTVAGALRELDDE